MVSFLLGIAVGSLAILWAYYRVRRELERMSEEKQVVTQETQIVVDFMHHMAEAIGENPTREELYQRIVHAAILCTGALSACIFEKNGSMLRGAALEGLFPPHRPLSEEVTGKLTTRAKFIEQVLRSESFPVGEGIVGGVAASRHGVLIVDAARDERIVKHDDPALEVKSVIAVPLIFGERMFGVLAVVNPADGLPFSETDFSLVQSLAEQAALALHNVDFLNFQIEKQQLDLDLSLASGVQQMLMPKSAPVIPGLEVDARYLPAQKIGGDLYDWYVLPGGKLGLAVADVSGKGIPASLLMAICRAHLRQIAPRCASPAQCLRELQRAMEADFQPGRFITMIYAMIDPQRSELVFARAGHELPLLMSNRGGQATGRFIDSEGISIGLADSALFDETIGDHREDFGTGDVLVVYTDGVTEAPNPKGKEFSGTRLVDNVRRCHRGSAKEINDGVLGALQTFCGEAAQRDDITLVTVKRVIGGRTEELKD